ncbi:hypothetical protein CASFOL_036655 [Castilleja foliolosa]|uniref:Uncharacterized protein n=1 Tax=Castilleja foliolosa TaxID=1961234 RepID=A0ABD3BNS5_9LAMI
MQVLSSSSLLGLTYPNPNPTRNMARTNASRPENLSIKIAATSRSNPCSPAAEFTRQLTVSSILLLGVGLSSLWAFPSPAAARVSPASPSTLVHPQETIDLENDDGVGKSEYVEKDDDVGKFEDFEDEDMKLAFERWKSKSYALTVPLRVVALESSVPPVWIREFLRSQGKRVRFRMEFRRSLGDIYHELSNPFKKGKINPKSAVSADLVTLGDSWLNFATGKELIEPIKGADEQDWFRGLSDKWKVYLRRGADGNLDSQGSVWAVPYRWGSMVIAYNNKQFRKHKLDPVEDWSDLWRPELAGKISMVDSPREIVGAVLKYMGASYNTTNIDSQVFGGKNAVLQQLELLVQQVRLFDTQHYLRAFRAGDVWVAVGWSSDIIPVAKTMSNVSVTVPKSGASLWADFWAIPSTSRLNADKFGGRVRGPSPLFEQWVNFCLQPERALPFKEEIVAGASPISLEASLNEEPRVRSKGRPKLETNLVANVPPSEILSRCEFLEPLSEDALSDYQWLMGSLQKPSPSVVDRVRLSISLAVTTFWSRMQFRAA